MIDFEPIDLHQREWTEHPSEHEEHEPFADHVKIVVAITEEGEAHVVSWHPYCRGVDEELANIGPSEMFSHLDTPGVYLVEGCYVETHTPADPFGPEEYDCGFECSKTTPLLDREAIERLTGERR